MSYTPKEPFEGYKWLFATKAPTESLGDPAVLLGLINRVSPIADGTTRYSSKEFADIMQQMDKDIVTTVDLKNRVGTRNLMRNSAQYWKAFGLIPNDVRGVIELTPFAKSIVSGEINQVDFASAIIVSFKLPNRASYTDKSTFYKWTENELLIHPFKLILKVIRCLHKINPSHGWLTNEELYSVIIPMAGDKQKAEFIAEYILKFRADTSIINDWYNAVPRSNDKRFSGEYLRFLANFGFLERDDQFYTGSKAVRDTLKFSYIAQIDEQITELVEGVWSENRDEIISMVRSLDINSAVVQSSTYRANSRPKQQYFRRELLSATPVCPFTDFDLPMVLQAAHIKPYAHGGDDEISNGIMLRADIHLLFDSGLLNLKPDPLKKGYCDVILGDDRAVRSNYRGLKVSIKLPDYIDMENVRWRYDNRLLGIVD